MNFENLSHDEIHQHIANLEHQRLQALNALNQLQKKGKYDLADTIRDMITEQGFGVEDILPLLTSGRRRSQPARTRVSTARPVSTPSGTYYVDPEEAANIYFRGAIPNWMKVKMHSHGLDPSNKEDRNAFKANYLQRVSA